MQYFSDPPSHDMIFSFILPFGFYLPGWLTVFVSYPERQLFLTFGCTFCIFLFTNALLLLKSWYFTWVKLKGGDHYLNTDNFSCLKSFHCARLYLIQLLRYLMGVRTFFGNIHWRPYFSLEAFQKFLQKQLLYILNNIENYYKRLELT